MNLTDPSKSFGAIAIACVLLIGCSQPRQSPLGVSVLSSCQLDTEDDPYFGRASAHDSIHPAVINHYGMLLYAMREPFLACGLGSQEAVRVIYSEVFSPDVRAVRITHDSGRFEVASVVISHMNGSWPVTKRTSKEIVSANEWDGLMEVIEPPDLSSLPAPPTNKLAEMRLDGDTLMIEVRRSGRYRVIQGTTEPSYREAARKLFLLAGADVPEALRPRQ